MEVKMIVDTYLDNGSIYNLGKMYINPEMIVAVMKYKDTALYTVVTTNGTYIASDEVWKAVSGKKTGK